MQAPTLWKKTLIQEHEAVLQRQKDRAPMTRFTDALRRFTQKTIVRNISLHDEAIVPSHNEYVTLRCMYTALLAHLKAQEMSLATLSDLVGNNLVDIVNLNSRIASDRASTASVRDIMRRLHAHTEALAPLMHTTVLPTLQNKILELELLSEAMRDRDNLEADFHTAMHKYEKAKRKGKLVPIQETLAQVKSAKHSLEVVTQVLIEKLRIVNATRGCLTKDTLEIACETIGRLMLQMAGQEPTSA
ncbi:Aste57867_10819 [Aphanomyces stellatus]|uniref:Aste57867_10819 protein n=1 Tax=Aphanomyces stellatus TaxID=120398 RepID=A0A485KRY1_9STRA|nr:hypothetical protein As57867_010779 [Aphanomyces stellatus]VFT87688.1 Aste57867_10819 [Aphanomyces stellatus]